ncbi:MAG: hypothetical protein WCB96_11455 [Candidatus Aminicenantales bacterium]
MRTIGKAKLSIIMSALFGLSALMGAALFGANLNGDRSQQPGGNIVVHITPDDAVQLGAKWRLAESPYERWKDSNIQMMNLNPGNYTLEFTDVDGYAKPAASTIRITSGETLSINAQYILQTSSLKVWIRPPEAVAAGGKWEVVSRNQWLSGWHNSGDTAANIPTIQTTLWLKDLESDEWNYPAGEFIYLVPNELKEMTLTYTRPKGTIAVDIQPSAARNAGAKWRHRKMGETAWSAWHEPSSILTGMRQASYQIEFMELAGWLRADFAQFGHYTDKNTVVPGTYTMNMGSLTVAIEPEAARSAGAVWRRAGTNAWLPSGRTVNYVPAGQATVEFFEIPGWASPGNQAVTIRKDQTASLTATYAVNRGSLRVNLTPPEAVAAGAKWRRVGTLAWRNSGETETQVPAGQCPIEFFDVSGWQSPAEQTVTLTKDTTNMFEASYISTAPPGSLTVQLGPLEARNACATWRCKRSDSADWSGWKESDNTVAGLASGSYSVEFKDLSDWQPPAAQSVTIHSGQTTYLDKMYDRKTGSLKVQLLPKQMPNLGAKWRRQGTAAWQDSDHVESPRPAGDCTIEFKPVSGWVKPLEMQVRIEAGQVNTFQATYAESVGSLTVTINPPEAESAGGMWRKAMVPMPDQWRSSGTTAANIPTGTQTVQFKEISGWTKPPDRSVTITAGQTASLIGTYTATPPPAGSLRVTITPQEAVTAGAKWHVYKTASWHSSDYTLQNIVNDSFTVEFKDVTGWTTPAGQNVTINQGQNITLTGTYTATTQAQTGSLRVTIQPQEAASAGARWQVKGSQAWQAGGQTQADIEIGAKTIEFKDITGWTTPSDTAIQINHGQTATLTATYTRVAQKGSLKVTMDPAAARTAGARWRLTGTTIWLTSGSTKTNLAVGEQTVEFKDITGWAKPGNQSVQITAGQTATLTVQYVLTSGSLKVTIEPAAARSAGAKWRPVGTTTWRSSNIPLSGQNAGSCTIEFKTLSGWNKPPDQTVTIAAGETTKTTATYTRQPGSLKVNLQPAAAVSAGAQWRPAGTTTWYDSGHTLSDIPAGSCAIEFKDVSGWRKPANKTVPIQAGGTTITSGVYSSLSSKPKGER